MKGKYLGFTINCFMITGLFFLQPALAEGNIENGKSKSMLCSACHGPDGNSINPEWPSLAGQHEKYFVKALKAYMNESRKNAVMYPLVMTLSEQDMMDLAAFYQAQTPKKLSYDYDLAKRGESLYRGGNSSGVAACIACHGPRGKGNPGAGYPSISGQHAAYTKKALIEYTNGNRKPGINDMMQTLASRMTTEEIDAVAEYIQALGSK